MKILLIAVVLLVFPTLVFAAQPPPSMGAYQWVSVGYFSTKNFMGNIYYASTTVKSKGAIRIFGGAWWWTRQAARWQGGPWYEVMVVNCTNGMWKMAPTRMDAMGNIYSPVLNFSIPTTLANGGDDEIRALASAVCSR